MATKKAPKPPKPPKPAADATPDQAPTPTPEGSSAPANQAKTNEALAQERSNKPKVPVPHAKRVVQPAPALAPNPPVQPVMVPAKQIAGATGDHVDARAVRAPRPAGSGIRVKAVKTGYYDDKLRRVDDVFDIRDESEFSDKWMVEVSKATPTKLTGSNADLRRTHDGIQAERLGLEVGRDDVPATVPTGTHDPLGESFA